MQQQAQELIRFLDFSINEFTISLPASEKQLFSKVLSLIKQLDTSRGSLKVSVQNVRLINQIQSEVNSIVSSDAYIGNVKKYLDSFTGVDELQQAYFSEITTTFSPPKVLAEIKTQIIGDVATGLTERGIGQAITNELSSIMRTNIQSGGSYADFTELMRTAILGADDSGILERHAGTYVTDAINQYSATYSKTVASDLGLKWGQYTGSLLTTSRPMCIKLVAKRWIYLLEIRGIINGNVDGAKVSTAGMNPDTTVENFPILRSGFNCRHQYLPVSEDVVPREIRIATYTKYGIEFDENGFALAA